MTIYECIKECIDYTSTDLCKYEGVNWSKTQIEQIAEWLEELMVYRQHEIICRNGYNAGYNNAIDDFVEKVKLKYIGVHPDELLEKYYPMEICEQIKELAEQLKFGERSEIN